LSIPTFRPTLIESMTLTCYRYLPNSTHAVVLCLSEPYAVHSCLCIHICVRRGAELGATLDLCRMQLPVLVVPDIYLLHLVYAVHGRIQRLLPPPRRLCFRRRLFVCLLAGLHYTTRNSAIADKPRTTKNTVTFKPGLGH